MISTPRTDRETYKVSQADTGFEVVGAALCRTLERELQAAQAAALAAPPSEPKAARWGDETADLLVLPEIIGPCSEIVERITDELSEIEGCETDQELVTQVLHAIKRLMPSGEATIVAATPEIRPDKLEGSGPSPAGDLEARCAALNSLCDQRFEEIAKLHEEIADLMAELKGKS